MCKKFLRYFGNVRHKSNVRIIQYDWLIVLYIFISLVHIASFLIIKNSCFREELTDVNSPLVRAPPQLTLFTSPTTPSTPRLCAVDNFQRFIFGSLPTSLQERLKQESTFTFTFMLRTIYNISKGVDLPPTMKESSLSISHTLSSILAASSSYEVPLED